MEQLSPILQARLQQQKSDNTDNITVQPNVDIANAKLKPLLKDSIEIDNDNSKQEELKNEKSSKKTKLKKTLLIGAGLGIAACAVFSVIRAKDLSKTKKELTALYDSVFDEFKKTVPSELDFKKPELVFKKLKGCFGQYSNYENTIEVDPKLVRRLNILDDIKKIDDTAANQLAFAFHSTGRFGVLKSHGKLRMASKNEALTKMGKTFYHELTHAEQHQMLLSAKDGKEKYIQHLKSLYKNLSENDIKKICPFVFDYQPNTNWSLDTQIVRNIKGSKDKIKYKIKDLLDASTNYTSASEDWKKYYTNFAEIEARIGENDYIKRLISGDIPRLKGVSDEYLNLLNKETEHNLSTIVYARLKHKIDWT